VPPHGRRPVRGDPGMCDRLGCVHWIPGKRKPPTLKLKRGQALSIEKPVEKAVEKAVTGKSVKKAIKGVVVTATKKAAKKAPAKKAAAKKAPAKKAVARKWPGRRSSGPRGESGSTGGKTAPGPGPGY